MDKELKYNLNLREPETQKSLSAFLDIIHLYSKSVINSKTEDDVFDALIKEITPRLNLEDCVIYKVDKSTNTMYQVAAHGYKKNKGNILNRLTLDIGEGFAGTVAKTGESLLISDVSKDDRYIKDIRKAGSEIEIPIKMNDEVYAVISSEHKDINFYNKFHVQLFEVLASIAVGTLIKIRENNELAEIKERLENILEKKSTDLDRAIEAISSQYSELKYHHEKRESLIQEVHHRVNNNLQIISSILKMYLNSTDNARSELQEVHNRVQAMALIHQNIYKSMEMNLVDAASYIRDLMNYLKSLKEDVYVRFNEEVRFENMSLNTLVPLGLFLTELMQLWIGRASATTDQLFVNIWLGKSDKDATYKLLISDEHDAPLFDDINFDTDPSLSELLIGALVEQLEGDIDFSYDTRNTVRFCFNPIE
jgi:two-component sensor histidine kinase